jgi:enamine deaminase RidA (YjgF/YER057c/UK114 family)
LKDAGVKDGWKNVYKVVSYHLEVNDEVIAKMASEYEKWCGKDGHRPIWTLIGVTRLGLDAMRVEIEVVAHVPQ